MPRKGSKSQKIVERSMHEVFTNEPSTVKRAKVSGARKRRMKVAIALSKARKAGARIPRVKSRNPLGGEMLRMPGNLDIGKLRQEELKRVFPKRPTASDTADDVFGGIE